MVQDTHAEVKLTAEQQRVREHAKLFTVNDRQVLVMLQRAHTDDLVVVVQVWAGGEEDHQLRALIEAQRGDAAAFDMFQAINDESIGLLMQETGLARTLAEVEAEGG